MTGLIDSKFSATDKPKAASLFRCGLIDSKFSVTDKVWYINGSAITAGVIRKVLYNYNDRCVYYCLTVDGKDFVHEEVREDRVFASEKEAKDYLSSNQVLKIERESEYIHALNAYIKLGSLVKKPMMVQLLEGFGRWDTYEYLDEKYGNQLLKVDGHPFKRGHQHFINENGDTCIISEHPELTENFFPPVRYSESNPPSVMVSTGMEDYEYCLECVEKLKIPFIFMIPSDKKWVGGDYAQKEGFYIDGPEKISEFEVVLYTQTVQGWLEDMNAEGKNYPQERLLESIYNPCPIYIYLDSNAIRGFADEYRRIMPYFLERRVEIFMQYVECLKDMESYDELAECSLFTQEKLCDSAFVSIPYRLNKCLPLYCTLYAIRLLYSEVIDDHFKKDVQIEVQAYRNLFAHFLKYLQNTEDYWVFDFSIPVPNEACEVLSGIENDECGENCKGDDTK